MNGPSMPSDPPFGLDADEALSAYLDGELDAFARDHGLTEAAARAELEAWPELTSRLAAFERARAAAQAPVPPLDDVTRRRLVNHAVDELPAPYGPARRSRRWPAIAAIAAAGFLFLAGIGAVVSAFSGDGSSSRDSASKAASSATAALHGDVGDLGDVTSASALHALLDRRETGGTPGDAPTAARSEPFAGAAGANRQSESDSATVTPAACARELAGTRKVAFEGTGTFRGAPVTIVGIVNGGRTVVLVVSGTDCTNVLASVSR
jgi:hypothetical protein